MNFGHSSQPWGNTTTINYRPCTEIRPTHVSHQSDSFSLVLNNSFDGTYGVAYLFPISWFSWGKHIFHTLYSWMVFLTRNSDFNCFSWIHLCWYSRYVELMYVYVFRILTHFKPMCHFYTPENIRGFLTFSSVI